MAKLDNDDFYDILNNTFIDAVSAAYTIYEAMMEGTKKKKMSKEDFVDMFRDNTEDFRIIMDRKITKEQQK